MLYSQYIYMTEDIQASQLSDLINIIDLKDEVKNISLENISLEAKTQKIKNLLIKYIHSQSEETLASIIDLLEIDKGDTDSQDNYLTIHNPDDLPDAGNIQSILEPILDMKIITPELYTGRIIELINDCRGETVNMSALSSNQLQIQCLVPLSEVIIDFYDKLKSETKGYGSMSYEIASYQAADLVKINFLINDKIIEPLSIIKHRSQAESIARGACEKLKKLIPKQQIEIIIQGAIGSKIIARETIRAFRKDVTAKLYGGDISRRMKLLDKQKAGKKRMKSFGNVNVPKEVFLDFIKN